MINSNPATGLKKHQQISKTQKQLFMMVAAASAAVVVALNVGMNLLQRISYQIKVNQEMSVTANIMKKNVDNINKIVKDVRALKARPELNVPNLKSDNSTPYQVVIDALPTEDDRVDLSSSLQGKILSPSGVQIDNLSVDQAVSNYVIQSSSRSSSSSIVKMPKAQTIDFSFTMTGSYEAIGNALKDLERTIRPIIIKKITINSSRQGLSTIVHGSTYYSSSVNFQMGSKEVPYE